MGQSVYFSLRLNTSTVKMKLFLAVAVLLMAFAAHTGAQEEEKTVEQRFAEIGAQVTEFSSTVAEKTKEAFEKIQTSETATVIRDWFSDTFTKVKNSLNVNESA